MPDAIFIREGDSFVPTDLARSPWGPQLLHGGPPAGLLARAIEHAVHDADMHPARVTIDLFRPVPKQPLQVEVEAVRQGNRIAVMQPRCWRTEWRWRGRAR
ncbi:MAG: thioesterase family protein [Dehalococcoidia bacterium]|nr:thioesterase family protein [Dehalococcoidia bacterium]